MAVNEGFQAVAQDYINSNLAWNYALRDPLLYVLANESGGFENRRGMGVGRPLGADVFAGTGVTLAEKESLTGCNAYKPSFAIANPTNVKIMGSRDTGATLSGATEGQSDVRGLAEVRWTGVISEQIRLWHTDLDRALKEAGTSMRGRGVARSRITTDAVRIAEQNVYNKLSTEIWTGVPTDQDVDPWDHMIGIPTWVSATNVCARVDRSQAKNANWRAIVDATAYPCDLETLINQVNITHGLAEKVTGGTQLAICNGAQYKAFKSEVKGKGGVEVLNGLPNMLKTGAKRECLRMDNVIVMWTSKCPANTMYMLYMPVWKFIVNRDHPFAVTPFKDMRQHNVGGPDYDQAFVDVQCMLACDNPALQVKFTGIVDPS